MLLKNKIKEKGIKQTWIADKVGVSKSLLHQYLTGRATMPIHIEKMIRDIIK